MGLFEFMSAGHYCLTALWYLTLPNNRTNMAIFDQNVIFRYANFYHSYLQESSTCTVIDTTRNFQLGMLIQISRGAIIGKTS